MVARWEFCDDFPIGRTRRPRVQLLYMLRLLPMLCVLLDRRRMLQQLSTLGRRLRDR
ncbi:MAG: hypothetical protein WB778_01250 [Thermoplasmata archaeon]|jgi:hypothetical protein